MSRIPWLVVQPSLRMDNEQDHACPIANAQAVVDATQVHANGVGGDAHARGRPHRGLAAADPANNLQLATRKRQRCPDGGPTRRREELRQQGARTCSRSVIAHGHLSSSPDNGITTAANLARHARNPWPRCLTQRKWVDAGLAVT